ncbi:MAG: hypothetical protein ACRD25_06345 [Terracidiphilus sp.]
MVFPLAESADEEGNIAGRGSSPDQLGRDRSSCALRYAAAGTLVAGGVLLLSGCRRTGLVTAVVGTALAMIDQQETMRLWWNALPVYLDEAQSFLGRVQGAVDDVTAQQRKVRDMYSRVVQAVRA